LFVATSIETGTAWALSEPNDETLWTRLRSDVSEFLHRLFLGGWFQGVDQRANYPKGTDPIVLGESVNTITTYASLAALAANTEESTINTSVAYSTGDVFVFVPAPGAVALLGAAGLVGTRRRR
jgi:hypothetical protein